MYRLIVEFNKNESTVSTPEILKKCNITEAEYDSWFQDFITKEDIRNARGEVIDEIRINHFEKWLDDALNIRPGEEREILRIVGLKHAIDGKFPYFKEMARTYGAISPEAVEHTHKIISFNLGQDSIDDLRSTKKKLLQAHRSVGSSGGTGMARLTTKRSGS